MSFEAPSLERLASALGDVAAAGAGEHGWEPALEAVTALLRGSTATIFMQRRADKSLGYVDQCGEFAPGAAYVDHYAQQDVLLPAVLKRAAAQSVSNAQIVEWSAFVRGAFYNEFAKPRDMIDCIHVRLFDADDESLFFAVTRSHAAGIFDAADRALVDLLVPHVGRAVRNSRRLAGLAGERDVAHAALAALREAVLITDATLRLHHANPAAERLLRAQGPLSCRDGRLIARRAGDTDALRRLVSRALTPSPAGSLREHQDGPALALQRSQGNPLLLHVLPLRPGHPGNALARRAAMIVVVDPDTSEQPSLAGSLRALYGLTAAEARVAEQVGGGADPAMVAESLAMKRTTVRWYLQRVFEKTGTARQSELVRLIERLGVARPPAR